MTRRRFAFWLGLCLFWISEALRANELDELAADIMRRTEPQPENQPKHERWSRAENRTWRWFERETLVDDEWKLTGITTPVHKETGERYTGRSGYLDEQVVPGAVRRSHAVTPWSQVKDGPGEGQPDARRRAREGRPPSQWLRSLRAEEIRAWLKTVDVPPVGVSGMTFWTHLTRDHSFAPEKIEGLTVAEQSKLHSAAHYGY